MRVFVYFNLHRKCWSIKALEGPGKGLVIDHSMNVELTDCTFKVSEAGRQRVLRENRKNVHAGVVGELVSLGDLIAPSANNAKHVTYNPRKFSTFVDRANLRPVVNAERVVMIGGLVKAEQVTYGDDDEQDDPSPYCSYGHRTQASCDCGPIASNE